TNAINFTGTIGTGVSLSLVKLDAVSHITMVGNLFYDLDQAATAKEGNFYTFLNNTVVNQTNVGSQDAVTGVLNYGDDSYHESGGMYAEGNVIQSAMALTRNYPGAGLQQTVVWNNNLFPPGITWSGAGTGNTSADARLNDTVIPTPGPRDYQRLAAEIRQKFGLQAGSPARGTGPNGTDKGGVRPFGVSISGAPSGTTNATAATLTIGTRMTGNGISAGAGAWQNGSGWTHYKWRLDGGAWSAETVISTPLALAGLANGAHSVDVTGKNDAGTYQDSADLGADARVTSASWIVDTAYVPPGPAANVRINEVLAKNTETAGFSGVFPDIIELYNAGNASAVLDGWGLTDNAALPYKFTFPASTTLAPGAYLVIYASSSASVPSPKTGFALKETGDTLTLTKSAGDGGLVADAVPFGSQIADLSIGRRPFDGQWDMCRPTFGSANVVAAQGSPAGVRINEWLTDARVLAGQDFVELFNPGTLPVNLGGGFLTDNPQDWPDRFQIRQLTFIGANGYTFFKADGDAAQGSDHLGFKLAPEQGEIGLFDSALSLVDSVVYGPQSTDVSQGRTPNGGTPIEFFTQPTPGAPNPQVSTGGLTQSLDLVLPTQVWSYVANATDPFGGSTAWKEKAFNDSAWTTGGGVLYIESSSFPANSDGFAKTTLLTGYNATHPYQTYYFRTHFNYTGTLNSVTFTAKLMADDAPVFYLNGQEITPVSGNRIRLPSGADTYALEATGSGPDATIETYTLNTNGLVIGDNVLAVSLHQSDTQSATAGSSDITWGLKLTANYLVPLTGADAVVINEVLPVNTAQQNPDGSFSGWVELYNPGATAADLNDVSVTNDVSNPRAFAFPAGTTIPAGGYLILYCNGLAASTATAPFNSGFPLDGAGGGVFVFKSRAAGGGLLSAVNYGNQIPDFSIGRIPNGSGAWALNTATRAALNAAAATVPVTSVKINEWLTDASPGWLELYNTSATPAALGGNFLTDDFTNRSKSLIPPLSFLAGSGAGRWLPLIADNDSTGAPGHVNFTLESGEGIALFTPAGTLTDSVATAAHAPSVTEGRFPDGSASIQFLTPTPGTANAVPSAGDSDGDGLPDAWETSHGLNAGNAADALLDGDHDGISNLLEYSFNLNPQVSDGAPLTPGGNSGMPVAQLVPVAGGKVLEVTFLRRKPPGGSHLELTAQFSGDLNSWTGGLTPTVTSVDADMEKVTVRDSVFGSGVRRFVRVSVAVLPNRSPDHGV
ncbi:MAG TPA: lamin tail domain-containing protein, partial [Verrucomicrobiales bacterium]|nr:lamin tail domain-containing protein [Verrucomicrobiales bacterium]